MLEFRSTKAGAFIALTLVALSGFPARAQVVAEFSGGITAGSRLLGIALGADHNVWFIESDASSEGTGNRIGRITPQGIVTEFGEGISAGAGLGGIAPGPDGNLWFTESNQDRIGRITLDGAVTEFSVGISTGANPLEITAGPDGNLWFTERNAGRIGRITPAGVVTEFRDGITSGALPTSIARGPDGNLWFTEFANQIGRITPAGVVTEFGAGITPGAILVGITAGPDGNMWFTEFSVDRIARITPAGAVTEFGAGISAGAQPQNIALGPDGNLWFTERLGARIGRITAAGVATEFGTGVTAHSRPAGIAAGEGADMWFTEDGGDRIGRITTGSPATIGIAFGAASVPLNGSTSLTFTLANPNALTALTRIAFTDGLPAGLAVAIPNGLAGDCGGGVITATPGSGALSLSGGSLAPAAFCAFSVNVTGIAAGTFTNITGNVTSLEGGRGATAPATLSVQGAPLTITSPAATSFAVGVAGTFEVTATGSPIPAIAVAGSLPPGLSFVDNRNGTATLSGKAGPGSTGVYPLTFTAANGAGPRATQAFTLSVRAGAGNALQIVVEPARPTATDDVVVRSSLTPSGCRLLDSPFLETQAGLFEALVFVTAEPHGCLSDPGPLEALVPLRVSAPGTYHVTLWKITGGSAPTPEAPETRADADVAVGDAEWLIPAAARADGLNGAHWTTDLEIFSTSAVADTTVTLTFLASGGAAGSAPQESVVVPPLGGVRLEDVLFTSFGLQQGAGALLVTSPSLGLRFAPSIGTPSGGGRIAQAVPAVPGRGKLRTGRSGVLFGIQEDETARTNLALANAGEVPAVVELALATDGTSPGATTRVTVPARGMTQVTRVVRALGVEGKVAGGRLTVTAVDAADGIAVMATIIDNATNAPRTVTPQ